MCFQVVFLRMPSSDRLPEATGERHRQSNAHSYNETFPGICVACSVVCLGYLVGWVVGLRCVSRVCCLRLCLCPRVRVCARCLSLFLVGSLFCPFCSRCAIPFVCVCMCVVSCACLVCLSHDHISSQEHLEAFVSLAVGSRAAPQNSHSMGDVLHDSRWFSGIVLQFEFQLWSLASRMRSTSLSSYNCRQPLLSQSNSFGLGFRFC